MSRDITIIWALALIACVVLFQQPVYADNVIVAIVSGFLGYMQKKDK